MSSAPVPKVTGGFLDAQVSALERLSDGPENPEDENPKQSDYRVKDRGQYQSGLLRASMRYKGSHQASVRRIAAKFACQFEGRKKQPLSWVSFRSLVRPGFWKQPMTLEILLYAAR